MIISTNIPQGYKSSPLGIIPKDWEVKRLGEVCRFLQTNTYSRAQMCDKGGEVNNIHYGDILTKYRSILDVRKTCIPFLLEENNVCNVLLQNGDIVMADTAEDEMVGKVCEIFGITKEKVVAGLHTIALRPQSKMFAACYLGYYMDSTCFHSRLIPYMQGIKVYSLTKSVIENSIIPLPPLAEQERIAELLGTWDRAIEMQKQLIDKLELRKKGLMQQLLTGKKRLPGFTGEWKKVRLGEVLAYEQPQNYLVANDNYKEIGIPVLTAGKTFVLGYTDETKGIFNNLPVIIFDDFTTESKYVTFPFKAKSSAMKMLKLLDKNNNLKVIFESMQMLKYQVKEHKRYWISEYSNLPIRLPSPAEQQKIADCLSALDYEIQKQTEKLNKYVEEKKGLMQVLLTGKKRI